MDRVDVITAAIFQALGACLPTLLFVFYAWDGGSDTWRAWLWMIGPVALILAAPLGCGNEDARRYSRALCAAYPVAPVLELLTARPSHGGAGIFMIAVVYGLIGGAAIWVLLKPPRRVSNREDPLQVSGDIVNTRPSGTKPR